MRILNLPFGVRDGVTSAGNFSARSQFEQTRHGKRLIGGYLSRISDKRLEKMREDKPTLGRLITISEGRALSPEDEAALIERGPVFVDRAALGYVVIDERFIKPDTGALVVRAMHLQEIARDEELDETINQILGHLVLGAPGAHAATKDLIRSVGRRPLTPDLITDTATRIAGARASEEGKEGIRAFLEKRKPGWVRAAAAPAKGRKPKK